MSDSHLLYQVSDMVGYFTINRESKKNSLSPEAINLFHNYLDQAEQDNNVRAIQITGIGDKAFCTGAELGDGMSEKSLDTFKRYADLLKKINSFQKPTVAKVNGYCLAGGTGLMLACDIVIASDKSIFGTPEVNVGLWPMMIGALIFRNVPRKKAMEMILLGERITAETALSMGLVTRVVPVESLENEVIKILKTLISKSPIGIKIGKKAFHAIDNMELDHALEFLSKQLAEIASTEDAKEGIKAFIEKRDPIFTGK